MCTQWKAKVLYIFQYKSPKNGLIYSMRTGNSCQMHSLKKQCSFQCQLNIDISSMSVCWVTGPAPRVIQTWYSMLWSRRALPQKLSLAPHCSQGQLQTPSSVSKAFQYGGLYSLPLNIPWTFSPRDFAYRLLCSISYVEILLTLQDVTWIPASPCLYHEIPMSSSVRANFSVLCISVSLLFVLLW